MITEAQSALVCCEIAKKTARWRYFSMKTPHLGFCSLFLSMTLLFSSSASHLKIGRRLLTSTFSVSYRCCLNSYKSIRVRTASAMQAQSSRLARATSAACWLSCPVCLSGSSQQQATKEKILFSLIFSNSLSVLLFESLIWSPQKPEVISDERIFVNICTSMCFSNYSADSISTCQEGHFSNAHTSGFISSGEVDLGFQERGDHLSAGYFLV